MSGYLFSYQELQAISNQQDTE